MKSATDHSSLDADVRGFLRTVEALARQGIKSGKPPRDVKDGLVAHGIPADVASAVVSKIVDQPERVREMAWKTLGIGALVFIGGAAFTAISYGAATPGGRFSVATGALVWGAVQALVGLFLLVVAHRLDPFPKRGS